MITNKEEFVNWLQYRARCFKELLDSADYTLVMDTDEGISTRTISNIGVPKYIQLYEVESIYIVADVLGVPVNAYRDEYWFYEVPVLDTVVLAVGEAEFMVPEDYHGDVTFSGGSLTWEKH